LLMCPVGDDAQFGCASMVSGSLTLPLTTNGEES